MARDTINHLNRQIKLIGAIYNWGGYEGLTQQAPLVIKNSSMVAELLELGMNISFGEMVTSSYNQEYLLHTSAKERVPMRKEFQRRVQIIVDKNLQNEKFPIIIGGDHSISASFWNSLSGHYKEDELVMILFDGRLDISSVHDGTELDNQNFLKYLIENTPNLKKVVWLGLNKPKKVRCKKVEFFKIATWSSLSKTLREVLKSIQLQQKFTLNLDLSVNNFGSDIWDDNALINLEYLTRSNALHNLASDDRLVGIEIFQYDPSLDADQSALLELYHFLKNTLLEV